ncbi:MAG TPA: chromate resistance protein ChrB domain-containing protein [Gemmatimonadaceae bacterium]
MAKRQRSGERRAGAGARPARRAEPAAARWLLLIHQIPPKPDYLRVKIGRRLQKVGSVAIKNSVYVLPPTAESHEDFQWIVREIEEGGGEAFVSEASLVGDGLTDETVRARFDAVRNEEYRAILADGKALLKVARKQANRSIAVHELAKLRRRYEAVSAIDFFGASEQAAATAILADIQGHLARRHDAAPKHSPGRPMHGAVWVTRRDVHVDRIASAWLIRRFIDRSPTFRFINPDRYTHETGELRFDMFEAEYTHVGDACTFETLLSELVAGDAALGELAEIVHDVDCKDAKFHREESPGLARMVAGLVAQYTMDEDRVAEGARLFDTLYAAFAGERPTAR